MLPPPTQTLYAVDPLSQRLNRKLAAACRTIIELHLGYLAAWGHGFLMLVGGILTAISTFEIVSSTPLSPAPFIGTACGLLLLPFLGESIQGTDISLVAKFLIALIYFAPPTYATFLIARRSVTRL